MKEINEQLAVLLSGASGAAGIAHALQLVRIARFHGRALLPEVSCAALLYDALRPKLNVQKGEYAVLQCIKAFCDDAQGNIEPGQRVPAYVIAAQRGIEKFVVDVRNEVVHGRSPATIEVRAACLTLLEWITNQLNRIAEKAGVESDVQSWEARFEAAYYDPSSAPNLLRQFRGSLTAAMQAFLQEQQTRDADDLEHFLLTMQKYRAQLSSVLRYRRSLQEYICAGVNQIMLDLVAELTEAQIGALVKAVQGINANGLEEILGEAQFPRVFKNIVKQIREDVQTGNTLLCIAGMQPGQASQTLSVIRLPIEGTFQFYDSDAPFEGEMPLRYGGGIGWSNSGHDKIAGAEERRYEFIQLDEPEVLLEPEDIAEMLRTRQ